ncbi:hypothetical protein HZP85_13990 [Elizabethkingia anophelis]|nr:hypothetical protein [Elizabethkingia anophelis]
MPTTAQWQAVVDNNGYYWSSSVTLSNANADYLNFSSGSVNISNLDRGNGMSVRCIAQ